MNTTPYLTTNLGKERPEGNPTPIRFVALGDIVAIHSRGQYRTAVVTKIGKTNVTTSYITAGGIEEAARWQEAYRTRTAPGREAFVANPTWSHNADPGALFDTYVAKAQGNPAEQAKVTNKSVNEFWAVG